MTRLVLFCVGLGAAFVAVAISVAAFGAPALYALGLVAFVLFLVWCWTKAHDEETRADELDFHASDAQRKKLAAIANLRADYAARESLNAQLLREARGGYHITPERPS